MGTSTMVGRATCPECGFASAHVKRSDRCLYRYCPECHSQHFARSARQAADLEAKTRPLDTAGATGSGAPPAAAPAAVPATGSAATVRPPAPPPAVRRSSLFGF